jgi:hypothetical protein
MPHTKKHLIIFFAVTFALKLILAVYFSQLITSNLPEKHFGNIAALGGDTSSYLSGIDNLLETGEYFVWSGQQKIYAGRMPFYGVPYFILRLFFSRSNAADIFVLLQIIFDALATVVFARLCYEISRRQLAFWLGWLFYFGCFNFSVLSIILLPESLSLGFFIFFLFYYHRFWTTDAWKNAVLSSVFLALLTVIKPYFVIIYPLFFLGVWFIRQRDRKINNSNVLSYFYKTAMLGLPLILLLSPWIVRNALVLGKFVPAQENIWAGYNYSKSHLAFADFVGAWGGGSIYWDADDAGCYFLIESRNNCHYSIPEYALTNGYNRENIERVRQNFIKVQENYSPESDALTAAEFARLTNIYRTEQPFRYYIGAKFTFLKKLFWHTNNYNLPINRNLKNFSTYQLSFKIIQFLIYALALTLGVLGLVKITIEGKFSALFILIALVTILFFLELRTSEQRYVSQILPTLLIGLTAVFSDLKSLSKLLNRTTLNKN